MATRKKVAASRQKKSSPKNVIEHDPLSLSEEEQANEVIEPSVIDLGCSLMISEVESCRNDLLNALQGGQSLILDGSEIEQIDGAGLQLLAAVALEAEKLSVVFKWHGASQILCEAAGQLGLADIIQLNEICQAA